MFKLVCDCGNEANISLSENNYITFNGIIKFETTSPFSISGGYDGETHLKCNKCRTSLDEK